ncbi:hypothetical protein [Sulfuriferula plumbiphila]|uniref:hypothetical protein n=2 Tax=Sulfuriferula plumbiphila TaxID=171865 RepID=UPI001386BEBE|nr:hypothetical protein [Sulfuriferula plumbiphila]
MLLILALVPLAGAVLAGIGVGQLRTRQYGGWFAAGAVFAAAGASLLPAMTGTKPAFALLLGLTLGCVAGIAVYALTEFLWPRNLANLRGSRREVREVRNEEERVANTILAVLLVAFCIGVAYSAKIAESMAVMLSLAVQLFWLAFALATPAVKFAARATMGLALAVIVLLGLMVGMALAEGLTGAGLVASLASGFGAALYMAVHQLLAGLDKGSEPRALAASFLSGYGAALVLVAVV